MQRTDPFRIFLVAGEPSGDILGARLIRALQRLEGKGEPGFVFTGVGGPMMEAAGMAKSLLPMAELSVMGLWEILPKARRLLRFIRRTAQAVSAQRPDMVLTIDSPGFAHRLAERINLGATKDIPRVHYVAPTVWAWRSNRVFACKRHFHHLLALLPFEPPYFTRVGLPCSFVGHPVLESGAGAGDGAAFRRRWGIAAGEPLLCLLPGSRVGEITRLLPVFQRTVKLLTARIPSLRVVLPVAANVAGIVEAKIADWPCQATALFGEAEKFDAMAAADVALAASGTVALELAMAGTPAVVAYKLAPATFFLLRRMAGVRHVHLLNIMMERQIVPERLQKNCRPEKLAADIEKLLGPDGLRQVAALQPALRQLRAPGGGAPSDHAAQVVLNILRGPEGEAQR